MAIDPVGRMAPAGYAARPAPRPAGGSFHVPSGEPAATSAAAAAGEVSLSGMLALQEIEDGAVRDREARRRGQDLLAELAALQRLLLAPAAGPPDATLQRLANLASSVPLAANPALRAAVAAIVLRSRVELARYHHDNPKNTYLAPR